MADSDVFRKGDKVLMYNADTKELDLEGIVEEVLEESTKFGESSNEFPAGSLRVMSANGSAALWIRAEHASFCLKKKVVVVQGAPPPAVAAPAAAAGSDDGAEDTTSSPPPATPEVRSEEPDIPDLPLNDPEVVAVALGPTSEVKVLQTFEAPPKLLGSWFGGSALGKTKVLKGTEGVVNEVTNTGDAVITFKGNWGPTWIEKKMFAYLEVVSSAKKDESVRTLGPSMWSRSTKKGPLAAADDIEERSPTASASAKTPTAGERTPSSVKRGGGATPAAKEATPTAAMDDADGILSPKRAATGEGEQALLEENPDAEAKDEEGKATDPSTPLVSIIPPSDEGDSPNPPRRDTADTDGFSVPDDSDHIQPPASSGSAALLPISSQRGDSIDGCSPCSTKEKKKTSPTSSSTTLPIDKPPMTTASTKVEEEDEGESSSDDSDEEEEKPEVQKPSILSPLPQARAAFNMLQASVASSVASLLAPPSPSKGYPNSATPTDNRGRSPTAAAGGGSPRPKHLVDLPPEPIQRNQKRVLIIGSGFGMELNPAQYNVVKAAGYQIHVVTGLPNPETPTSQVHEYIPPIKQAIEEFKPDVVVCASKGGAYMVALWQLQLWTGPVVIINKHPQLVIYPKDTTIILCHGSNDEWYQYPREIIENLNKTGSPNRCLMYYTGNSGVLGNGYTREGDKHNMQSLLMYDCLPRLLDAAMSGSDPEMYLMSTWDRMIRPERVEAEKWLGFECEGLRQFWQSQDQMGMDDKILFEVSSDSEEYAKVKAMFKAQPAVTRAYFDMNPGLWETITLLKIERCENGMQMDGNAAPYYKALQRGIEAQGLAFKPGLHTKWAFHGSSAVDEIVTDPIAGFQPLMSGSRASSLWGPGTYFARDAKYVYDGGFCKINPDGSKQMLLCLMMSGIPCLGDPLHKGVLPVRHGRHRYNSSVDSLSNPEIYVTQSPGAAYPAYVITFR